MIKISHAIIIIHSAQIISFAGKISKASLIYLLESMIGTKIEGSYQVKSKYIQIISFQQIGKLKTAASSLVFAIHTYIESMKDTCPFPVDVITSLTSYSSSGALSITAHAWSDTIDCARP